MKSYVFTPCAKPKRHGFIGFFRVLFDLSRLYRGMGENWIDPCMPYGNWTKGYHAPVYPDNRKNSTCGDQAERNQDAAEGTAAMVVYHTGRSLSSGDVQRMEHGRERARITY